MPHPQIFQLAPHTPQHAVLALHERWTLLEDVPAAWQGYHRTITWSVPELGPDHVVRYIEHAEWLARFFVLPADDLAKAHLWEVLSAAMPHLEPDALLALAKDELTPQHDRVEALLATAPHVQGTQTDQAYLDLLERLIDEEHGPLTHAAVVVLGGLNWERAGEVLERVAHRGDAIASQIARRALDAKS